MKKKNLNEKPENLFFFFDENTVRAQPTSVGD